MVLAFVILLIWLDRTKFLKCSWQKIKQNREKTRKLYVDYIGSYWKCLNDSWYNFVYCGSDAIFVRTCGGLLLMGLLLAVVSLDLHYSFEFAFQKNASKIGYYRHMLGSESTI